MSFIGTKQQHPRAPAPNPGEHARRTPAVLANLCLLAAGPVPPAPPPDAVLIEAEAIETCVPGGAQAARAHDLAWASNRTALVRFSTVERATWRFRVEHSGLHELWLRYAANGECTVSWSLDGSPWRATRVPETGALEGRGAWSWASLGTLELESGVLELTLKGAPLRPDCFLFTAPGQSQPDWPPAPVLSPPSQVLLKKLAAAPPRKSPAWLSAAAQVELPDWLEETRASLHTRLSVAWIDQPQFTAAEAAAAALGAPAIVRHVKSMSGQCYWPSAWGAVADWAG